MSDLIPRPLLVRLVIVTIVAAALWITLVKPARAGLAAERSRLVQQQEEVRAHAEGTDHDADLQKTADAIHHIATNLEQQLTKNTKSKKLLGEIDRLASAHDIQINRSEPLGSTHLPSQATDGDPIEIFSDRVSISFAGTFDNAAKFLAGLQHEIGVNSLAGLRITPAGEERVSATVELAVFRLGPKSAAIIPSEATSDAD